MSNPKVVVIIILAAIKNYLLWERFYILHVWLCHVTLTFGINQ